MNAGYAASTDNNMSTAMNDAQSTLKPASSLENLPSPMHLDSLSPSSSTPHTSASSWNHGDIIDISPSRSVHYKDVGTNLSSRKLSSSQPPGHLLSPAVRLLVDGNGSAGSGVALAFPERPYDRVCVRPNGNVFFFRGTSKGCMFIVEQHSNSNRNTIDNIPLSAISDTADMTADAKPIIADSDVPSATQSSFYNVIRLRSTMKVAGESVYLTCSPSGEFLTTRSEDPRSFLDSIPAVGRVLAVQHIDPSPPPPPSLEPWQLSRFEDEGFLVVEQVVEFDCIERCQRLLMHSLGIPGAVSAGDVMNE